MMNIKKIALLIIMSLAVLGYAQEVPIKLTIKSEKEIYKIGEDIAVSLTMKNTGRENVKPYYLLKESFINIAFKPNSTKENKILKIQQKEIPLADWLGWRGDIECIIPTNSEFTYRINIKKMYPVNESGTLSIIWKHNDVVSNTINLKVTEKNN